MSGTPIPLQSPPHNFHLVNKTIRADATGGLTQILTYQCLSCGKLHSIEWSMSIQAPQLIEPLIYHDPYVVYGCPGVPPGPRPFPIFPLPEYLPLPPSVVTAWEMAYPGQPFIDF